MQTTGTRSTTPRTATGRPSRWASATATPWSRSGIPRSDIDYETFFTEQGAKGFHNSNYEQDNAPGGAADPGRSLRSTAISAANMNGLRG